MLFIVDLKLFGKSNDQNDSLDEEGYKYLGITEYNKVKHKEMKTEFVREYKRRIRLILISKLNGKNKRKAINS